MPTDAEFEFLERQYELNKQVQGRSCMNCHKPMFFSLATPTIEGQVYSQAGISETHITGYCEHCFDEITKEPDDGDNYTGPTFIEFDSDD